MAEKPGRGANLSIETVRRLRSSAALLPLESDRRIVIVDDAETLLEPAQQALLKTLEEPPPTVTILLLTDEQELLLETVRSRCQQVTVRPVSNGAVERALLRHGVAGEIASEIASLSRGCAAWAIGAADDKTMFRARKDERESASAWLSSSRYERMAMAFRLGEQFAKRRGEVLGVVQATVLILRDEMYGAVGESQDGAGRPVLFAHCANAPYVLSQAIRASLLCLSDLDANVRPRLAMEAMVLQWPNTDLQSR